MKIAYRHLLEFLIDKPSIDDVSEKLFQLGHEHEIEDSIFDMEFTPNRGDCFSLMGLARDLNVFYKTNLDVLTFEDEIQPLEINFINNAKDKCPNIAFLNIQIADEVFEYKDYLNNYFTDLNINKNNFFTDVSNYIAYEMGQPVHSYDFSFIDGDITLEEIHGDSSFKTLLGNSIELKGSDLVFTSKGKIINLSGIIGGMDTACSDITTNALIECAYFRPESIMGKSIKYNLHSDASQKFERGTDRNCHEKILRRFIQIVQDHARITKLELYQESNNLKDTEIDFNLNIINKILGMNVSEEVYGKCLMKLGFKINNTITVPSYRNDINHQNDLAEELARVVGYDNIPVKKITLPKSSRKFDDANEKIIKSFFIDNGFSEVINSPFCSKDDINSIEVDNPLDSNRKYIRTNIENSLLENVIYNEKRQKDSIKLFELSDIYTLKESIQKEKRLCVIVSGRKAHNYKDFSQKLDNKYLKDLFNKIDIDIDKKIINIDRSKINSKIKTPIFSVELEVNNLIEKFDKYTPSIQPLTNFIQYKSISEFPTSHRDLSFSVKDSSKIKELINILSNIQSDSLKSSFMFDFYKNKISSEIKVGFRFTFQSFDRTLTDNEIDNEIKTIVNSALAITSVSLPGNF